MLKTLVLCALCALTMPAADALANQHVDVDQAADAATDPLIPTEPDAAVRLRIGSADRQVWRGFGGSTMADWTRHDAAMDPERRARLCELLFDEAGLTTMRIWFIMRDYAPEEGVRDVDAVMSPSLVALLEAAQERGLRHLVLAPAGVPDWIRHEVTERGADGRETHRKELREDRVDDHAAVIADFIAACRDRHGLVFEATGVQNELNAGHDCWFSPAGFVASVKALRSALDARGLHATKVIGPETSSCDHVTFEHTDALDADPAAWSALGGLATHSYNMAVTDRLADIALERELELWQTEASSPGRELPGDLYRAGVMQTTILSDINHAVTHWIHFIAAAPTDPRDNGTRIIAYDPHAGPDEDWLVVHRKHVALCQLSRTFEPGAVIRRVDDLATGTSAVWTYGRKPPLTYAAGRNPDGSWAIAVSNFTYGAHPSATRFARDNAGQPPQRVAVTVQLPADCPAASFSLHRSGGEHRIVEADPVAVTDGTLGFVIGPMELVTLRSAPR